jgi:hypothetical protein
MHIIANQWNGLAEGYKAAKESSALLSRQWSENDGSGEYAV